MEETKDNVKRTEAMMEDDNKSVKESNDNET